MDSFKIYVSKLENLIFGIMDLNSTKLQNQLHRRQFLLSRVLDQESLLDKKLRTELKSHIGNVKWITASEFLKTTFGLYMYKLSALCSSDGLSNNMFIVRSRTVPDVFVEDFSSSVLTSCPGTFTERNSFRTPALGKVDFVSGHELGHLIDHAVYPDLYKNLRACHKEKWGKEWSNTHFNEITADSWGIEVFSRQLSAPMYKKKRLQLLQKGLSFLCDQKVSPSHPSGKERLEVLGRHPRIRKLMGCKPPTKEKPACTLAGAEF